ncbi:hypothetical protein [Butyrivibrio fibrisolvens]|uniref:hypothetical protein n=1 Tax=Butyrivibrio fibrisolvens TaxID=831 RepID=UPI0020BE565E|nr:hypothetical protein [Butyrivibrio fibrisolvens]
MFKICSITLISSKGEEYVYKFNSGINFFRGSNDTGKTEFYKFIDYMFGSSSDINTNDWNNGTVVKAVMEIINDEKKYRFTRTNCVEENYFCDNNDYETEAIGIDEYRDCLGNVFSHNEDELRRLRDFTGENYTYRTFTMFNFLGENGQGETWDFLDKCRNIKYAIKLGPILDYIFNENVSNIEKILNELEELKEILRKKEAEQGQYFYNIEQVNNNLLKLNIDIKFNGNNVEDVLKSLQEREYELDYSHENIRNTISELEVIYSNISEQIKTYETTVSTYEHTKKENENREKLLTNLAGLVEENPEMSYLIEPINGLLKDVENSISFSKYIISDETVLALRKQQANIRHAMRLLNSKYRFYSITDKAKAVALIREYLSMNIKNNISDIEELKKRISDLKRKLRTLRASDNKEKIDVFSDVINQLYSSAVDASPFVKFDLEHDVNIKYIKKGNRLQTTKSDNYLSEKMLK